MPALLFSTRSGTSAHGQVSVHYLNGNEMELQLISHASLPGLLAFGNEVTEANFETKHVICFEDSLPEIRSVTLSGQEWLSMSGICSALEISEAGKNGIASVKAKQYGGYLYAVTSYSSGPHNEVNAWQLIPESLYTGITMDKVDWEKVHAEKRYGYSYLGLRVKVAGKVMICAQPVNFLRGLPTVQPITLLEAQAYDKVCRPWGWRATSYGEEAKSSWHMLAGHPLVIYERAGKPSRGTLICKIHGQIQDFHLSKAEDGLNYDTEDVQPKMPTEDNMLGAKTFGSRPKQSSEASQAQACLF